MTRALVALIAVILVACSDTTDPSYSPIDPSVTQAKVQNEWTPISFVIENYCTGEDMDFVGWWKWLRTITEDAAGGYHISLHRNWKGTATGQETGTVYSINFPINKSEYIQGPFPYTLTTIWYNNVTCRGECPTQLFRITHHVTISAYGEITAERDTYSIVCEGP